MIQWDRSCHGSIVMPWEREESVPLSESGISQEVQICTMWDRQAEVHDCENHSIFGK